MGACVLLVTAIGASALLSAGTVQAAPCPGTAVAAGTTCTDTGTVNFTGGALTLVSPTALTWTGTGTGVNQSLADATTAHQAYVVDDATGSGAGWNVTVSATTFAATGPVYLPTTAFSTNGSITSATATTGPTAACSALTTCTLPTDTSVTYPVAITTALTSPTPVKIYDALANTGLGSITIGLPGANPVGWWVAVPANVKPGIYTSTVTLGIVTAP
jgi:hypothetical protein